MGPPIVIVDAENTRRSLWPNLAPDELVELSTEWASREGVELEVVFDGRAPAGEWPPSVTVIGSAHESADTWIARRAAELRSARARFWLVTSDRQLRDQAGAGAERLIGGGSFARGL